MGIRAFDLCPSCTHFSEIKTVDPPVEIPIVKCCLVIEIISCVRLGRLWPACRNNENVFAESETCREFSPGVPRQFSFFVIAPKA